MRWFNTKSGSGHTYIYEKEWVTAYEVICIAIRVWGGLVFG